jgi:hypothetical protein
VAIFIRLFKQYLLGYKFTSIEQCVYLSNALKKTCILSTFDIKVLCYRTPNLKLSNGHVNWKLQKRTNGRKRVELPQNNFFKKNTLFNKISPGTFVIIKLLHIAG